MAFRRRNRVQNTRNDDEDSKIVHDLAALLYKNGGKLLKEETKLSLTLGTLNSLNRSLSKIQRNDVEDSNLEDDGEIVSLSSTSSPNSNKFLTLEEELVFLKDILQRIAMVKVSQGTGTVQGSVDVSLFESLKGLEFKRVPIHLLVGLQALRPHLKIISCFRCVTLLEDLFETCGGDRCSPFSWPELLSATLSFNTIERIDDSLRLLPMLVYLDLSHNLIKEARGLEVLTELEYLNLSYNQLRRLPVLGSRARIRLKILAVRNNELETLEGLNSMSNLQQVDLAYNCFMEHCCLSPFLSLPLVRLLCLEGNPLSVHNNHRLLTAEHLHFKSLVTFTIIDGRPLLKTEIAVVRNHLSSCRSWKHSTSENYGNPSINTVRERSDLITSIDNDRVDFNFLSHETGSDVISSSGEFGQNVEKSSKRKPRKSPLVREVSFAEDSGIEREEQSLVDSDHSEIAVIAESQPLDTLQSTAVVDHVAAKNVIEKFRRQHGSEWLIIGSKMSVLTPVNDPNESNDCVMASEGTSARIEERMNRQSRVSDDVVVLNTESEPPIGETSLLPECLQLGDNASMALSATESAIGIPWEKQVSMNEDDDDDEDALLPPFIIQMEKPGMDGSTTILVVVSDQDLKEKDSLTGQTVERFDLRSICSVETVSSSTKYELESGESPKIRITFSYVRKDRRERIYTMEDRESHQQFLALLKPFTDAKTFDEMMLGALQCLKCSAQFSREVAKKVLRKSNRPLNNNNGPSFSSSLNNSKGYLSEVNACPNCDSELVMEIQSGGGIMSPPPMLNGSLPAKGSSAFESSFKGNGPRLNQSLQQRTAEDDIGSSQRSSSCRSLSSDLSISRRSGSCSIVQVEAEVHHTHEDDRRSLIISSSLPFNSNNSGGEDLRRCGSDITILSNPSQHSIMVVPNPSLENSPLDVISESSVSVLRVDTNFQTTLQNLVSDRSVPLLTSGSSGSLTDSACTTLERPVYDSTLARTPDSFLSALSGKERTLISPSRHLRSTRIDEDSLSSRTSRESSCAPVGQESTINVPSTVVESELLRKRVTWSCRNAAVEYSFVDFAQVDHRLRLYIDMEVLDETEELVALLRTGVVPYAKGEEWPGLLVISQSKVHILKITKEETDQPFEWLQKYETWPLALLKHLNIRLGNQAFQLEFGPKTTPVCFTFIVRDANHCNNFVTYILEKFRADVLDIPKSKFESGLDGEETLQTIREHLLHWKPNCFLGSGNYDEGDDNEDLPILLYLMCYWIPPGNNSYEPVSIVMTSTDIYLVSEDLHWPLPHLILPPTEVLSRPQMTPLDRKKIQDVTAMEQIDEHPLEITLIFLNEDTQQEIAMKIATETEESLNEFVHAIRDPWEKLFGVNLQINMLQRT